VPDHSREVPYLLPFSAPPPKILRAGIAPCRSISENLCTIAEGTYTTKPLAENL
jgi:hypothetical protein